MRRWGLVALLLVVLLSGFATAARSSDRTRGKSFSIYSKFRIDLTGTNAVDWTMAPGSACSATGSGSQQIQVTTAGRAADRTFKLGLSVYRGKVANVTFRLPLFGGTEFAVARQDDREGSITGGAGGDCEGLAGDLPLGGPGSLCGITKNPNQQIDLRANINVAKDEYVVKNGGLELGFTIDPVGGADDPYFNDPNGQKADCPLAGDETWLPIVFNGQAYGSASQDSFLLEKYDRAVDAFESVPSYAPFSLAKLESCKAKTITAQTSAHATGSGAFGINSGAGAPPPNWAHWNSTTTLNWKMTLHRIGRCLKKRD